MSELVYKSYLFSLREFIVLSACAGIKKLYIFDQDVPDDMSEEELNLTVFRLYRKGALCWKDGKSFRLDPQLRGMFQDMKDSQKTLQIYSGKGQSPQICFWGRSPAVVELSENDLDAVRFYSLPSEVFLKNLCDRGILPEEDSVEPEGFTEEEEDEAWGGLLRGMSGLIQDGQILTGELLEFLKERQELLSCIAVCEGNTETPRSLLFITDRGLADWLVCVDSDGVKAELYSMENLKGFLAV